jgi:hypothetical protein
MFKGNMFTRIERDMVQSLDRITREMPYFDIVIPVGPYDSEIIIKQMEYTQKNIIGYRNIYLVSCIADLQIEGCITIPENIFPFSIETLAEYNIQADRRGWYLQQLLKLYAGFVIPNILDKYLVLDADTFFLKPTVFYHEGKCLYNYGYEYHSPYFVHIQKMLPGFKKFDNKSGITHHMMFETKFIKELFTTIENIHGDLFYKVFLKSINIQESSGASEYELYFNFIRYRHPNEIIIRKLNWANIDKFANYPMFDYISYHYYNR